MLRVTCSWPGASIPGVHVLCMVGGYHDDHQNARRTQSHRGSAPGFRGFNMVNSVSDPTSGVRREPRADIGSSEGRHEKSASFALTFFAALAFLYPLSIALLFSASMMMDDGVLAYRALRAALIEEQFGWLTEHWSALPAASTAAALALLPAKRAIYVMTAMFLLLAVLSSIWLSWISNVDLDSSWFRGPFVGVADIQMQDVYTALRKLEALVRQTRDLAVIAISGGAGVMGVKLAQTGSRKYQKRG